MKKEKKNESNAKIVLAFLAGVIVALLISTVWNYLMLPMYGVGMPYYGMMPMMTGSMTNMMNYRVGEPPVDCSQFTAAQFEKMGDDLMEKMMGREAHEKIDASMAPQTLKMMHESMGRMATGC